MEREEHARGRGFRSQESPTCPFSPPCSHLYRSGPPRTRARNYTSRQDASARTRTGASAMATVLSRALKLPGKKPQPRDHLAPAGPGEVGRGGSGGEADRVLAPTRKEVRDRGGEAVQPPGAGVHASPGAHGALGGSGGHQRGASLGETEERTLEARGDGGPALRWRRMSERASSPLSPGKGGEVSILFRAPRRMCHRVSSSFYFGRDLGEGRGRYDGE